MHAYLLDWTELLLRWLHLVAGAAWIGASFYFVMLDNSLEAPRCIEDRARGVHGEMWAVHGGGFYNSQKFLQGPVNEALPETLHWSKWEAYTTWLSGMGLLLTLYWAQASVYLIDPAVQMMTPFSAVLRSAGLLLTLFLAYDILSRLLAQSPKVLGALIAILILASDWLFCHWFSAHAAYILVGAGLGSMMAGNVFLHIIPGQKRMLAQIRAGQAVDPRPGQTGRLRSVHNTYFTLPVLFIMISGHSPMTWTAPHAWLVLAGLMLAGAWIRHFFIQRLKGKPNGLLLLGAASLLILIGVMIAPSAAPAVHDNPVSDARIAPIVGQRCLPCHALHPTPPGFKQPPTGLAVDRREPLRQRAQTVQQLVQNHAMPLGNLTHMTAAERVLLVQWCRQQLGSPHQPAGSTQ